MHVGTVERKQFFSSARTRCFEDFRAQKRHRGSVGNRLPIPDGPGWDGSHLPWSAGRKVKAVYCALSNWYDSAMAKCKLLAFLLCERATAAADQHNKVTLHNLFDRIVLPLTPGKSDLIFAYYKIDVKEPCTVALRITDPFKREIRRDWRHPIEHMGPIQGVWALDTDLFKEPGRYVLEMDEEGPDPHPLASMDLIVDVERK